MGAFSARYTDALAQYTHPDDQRALRENQRGFHAAFRRLVNQRLQDDISIDRHTQRILGELYTVRTNTVHIDGHDVRRLTVSMMGIAAVVEPSDRVDELDWYAQLCCSPWLGWHVIDDCLTYGLGALPPVPVRGYISAHKRQRKIQERWIQYCIQNRAV
ncbi:MAG TPA: hypothetical protein VJC16_02730 [Candidatus Nanoarchaeia archaeon]|nr:hypothetical protein [Candidatus Nanoarchaeia archaeon]